MSLSFLIGNLLGRAVFSFFLVWLVWLAISKFNTKVAWVRVKRWYSLLIVALLTLLGFGSAVVQAGGLP